VLVVPHYRQKSPDTCLPACVRMVLAYRGRTHSERELVRALGTVRGLGTNPESAIAGLESMGYHALWFENATLERLIDLLGHDWPVIVFLRAASLPHGRTGLHAVVLVEIDDVQVTCLDPSLDRPLALELVTFLSTWRILGHQGLVVWVT
jgi:ABC-type bacteriocin/lantibiotic exporter with double-glycine peptidase domain